jgi:predicted restriction endonuclease
LSSDEGEPDESSEYVPADGDQRKVVERQIRQRRGQEGFRDALRERYLDRCVVTECEIVDLLEAAHIKPYRGDPDNHPANGLLLRSDIHTLFDLDLLAIEPSQLVIELHPAIASDPDYKGLAGKKLAISNRSRPSKDALQLRYDQFRGRL